VVGPHGDPILHSLIRPTCAVEPEATRLHGLDATALTAAPSFAALYPQLESALRDHLVIAYWAVFDRSILAHACRSNKLPTLPVRWDCAHTRYAAWRGFAASLSTACEIEGFAPTLRHRATSDARLVWELIQRMAGEP
jgi:DNA polymerase III epsilon subunit-like protein